MSYGTVVLNEERTLEKLGIDITKLSSGSHKRVYVDCLDCGELFLREYRNLDNGHSCPTFKIVDNIELKRCGKCRQFLKLDNFGQNKNLKYGLDTYCKQCKKEVIEETRRGSLKKLIHHHFLFKRKQCKMNNIDFDLTEDHLNWLWNQQDGLCYYSRVPMSFSKKSKIDSPTLERINPNDGYTIDNVVWACRGVNLFKSNTSIKDFMDFMDRVYYVRNFVPTRIEFKKIHPDAILPSRSKSEDAGYDLTSIEDTIIQPHSTSMVRTGIIFTAPSGFYFTIEGRSSLFKHGIVPARGIIDATYCGELLVALTNNSGNKYNISTGDRIAQIIIHKTIPIDVIGVEQFSRDYNIRGEAGFGSTGK